MSPEVEAELKRIQQDTPDPLQEVLDEVNEESKITSETVQL